MWGKGAAWVKRQRRQHGKDGCAEVLVRSFFLLFRQVTVVEDLDAVLLQGGINSSFQQRYASASSLFTSRRIATSCPSGLNPSGPASRLRLRAGTAGPPPEP